MKIDNFTTIDKNKYIVDLTKEVWEYVVDDSSTESRSQELLAHDGEAINLAANPGIFPVQINENAPICKNIIKRNDWRTIAVGRRWEKVGHPELNNKTVWHKFEFYMPKEWGNFEIGFFCTSVDDEAFIYLNDFCIGYVKYALASGNPVPVKITLTSQIKYGAKNTLLIEVKDKKNYLRGGGILGNVCLFRTLRYNWILNGNLKLLTDKYKQLSVLLHLGAVVLEKNGGKVFSVKQLEELNLPPYILRDDELILIVPGKGKIDNSYKLELNNVSPIKDNKPLSIKCGKMPSTFKQYELLNIPITVEGTYDNPFDPEQINVFAIVTTPSEKVEKISAFFSQDFVSRIIDKNQEILLPKKCNPWKLYYRPQEPGVHHFEFFAQDNTGICHTKPVEIKILKSRARGFLRQSKNEPRFFEFDNGDSFFATGPSGWFRDSNFFMGGDGRWITTKMMDNYYKRKGENGCTFEYLPTWFFGRLYLRDGIIDQQIAWKLEHNLRTMEKNNIYWLVMHDDIRRFSAYGFHTLPYAVEQGGPCKDINQVYVNENALRMQKNHLRYIISRMSDSTSLWIWNCGDECQPGDVYSKPMVRTWLKELHNYVKENDIYKHAHAIGEGVESIQDGGNVVLLPDWYLESEVPDWVIRRYGKITPEWKNPRDVVKQNIGILKEFSKIKYPIINSEGGLSQYDKFYYLNGEKYDLPEAVPYHHHLWISLFLKNAAGGTDWLCNVLDRDKQLFHAKAINAYLKGESLTKVNWQIKKPEMSVKELRGFVLLSKNRSLAWIQNSNYTWYNVGVKKQSINPISNARVIVPVSDDGNYKVQLWDTRTGKITYEDTYNAKDLNVSVSLPDIVSDLALKIIYI